MGFSEAVQWWEEWQLRILVLGSLSLQYFLFVAAALRKRRTPSWFRSLTWLAYLGSDALAIFALATLFNRHKQRERASTHRSNDVSLEVLWVPILLLHLGGQDGITAHSIEDNQMWARHVLTAMSQIAIAIYVFRKSWSGGDERLFKATILTFIPGILKCLEKPWALKKASINSMARAFGKRVHEATGVNSLDGYVQAAARCVRDDSDGGEEPSDGEVNDKPYRLFVDLPYSYFVRLQNLKCMVRISKDEVQLRLCSGLSNTFHRLYTKSEVYKGRRGGLLRGVSVILTFSAIWFFHKSDREAYDDTDVKVTFILLWFTAALEYISVALKSYLNCFLNLTGLPQPDQVAQYNLIGHLACNKKRAILTLRLGCLDRFCCMPAAAGESSGSITNLVHDHITHGWRHCITDVATYRSFNDNRGQWTLAREGCGNLETRLQRPFDESVLVWHLATDFCFHQASRWPPEAARHCRVMSNYMAYLLFVNPEMLMPGARHGLIKAACNEIMDLLKMHQLRNPPESMNNTAPPVEADAELAKKIFRTLENSADSRFAHDALALAKGLMGISDRGEGETKMWKVIQGAWVEMLCFSAARCRGYLHAKSLGNGGEYLSYVWLLLWYMGMETLAERMQRTELHENGDMGVSPIQSAQENDRARSFLLPIFTTTTNWR
ncbi:uncharacterized protein LOC133900720 [Phragmites australis]|uniref:uncharacterized protein LOC133900720 n=1 Tax=Phragmites australis TaxID=29695 RepID=UPI002D7817A0|nr:uncharacterized protein LOC133900720 [Phragmites australis]